MKADPFVHHLPFVGFVDEVYGMVTVSDIRLLVLSKRQEVMLAQQNPVVGPGCDVEMCVSAL